ncbi:MAG: hypothetical protein NZM25_05220 [Leptospiraceae bacterium]|nr:hypothetical protein [Leptospiraceae bacterium]MDW8305591.1 hypothetical protein [Leptospiraceae bacterium]
MPLGSREEAYQAIFDLYRELSFCDSDEKIYRALFLGITAYLGSISLAMYAQEKDTFYLRYVNGYQLAPNTVFPGRVFAKVLQQKARLFLVGEVLPSLPEEEKFSLEPFSRDLAIPAMVLTELKGFLLLRLSKAHISPEEKLFLELLSACAGIYLYFSQIYRNLQEKWELNERRTQRQALFNETVAFFSQVQTKEELDQRLHLLLTRDFGLVDYLLYRREGSLFRPVVMSDSLGKMVAKFLYWDDPLIQELGSLKKWSLVERGVHNSLWRKLESFLFAQSLHEVAEILPLYFKGELYGFFFLLQVKERLLGDDRYFLQGILEHWLAISLSLEMRERYENASWLELVRDKLAQFEEALREKEEFYCGAVIRIVNLERLESLFGKAEVELICSQARKIIESYMARSDFFQEYLPGSFFFLKKGWDADQAFVETHKIQSAIHELYERQEMAPLVRCHYFCRPRDPIPHITHLFDF